MPMPIIHLCVAEKLIHILKINNIPDFYLGAVSPDAFYLEHTYYDIDGKHERHLTAHLTDPDFSVWRNKVNNFISENNTAANSDFYLGYGAHILTDIFWQETVYAEFINECGSWEETRMIYYSEAKRLDCEFYRSFELNSRVRGYLSNSREKDINGLVTAEEVKSWKKSILLLFDEFDSEECKNPLEYISYNKMINFITNAAEKNGAGI